MSDIKNFCKENRLFSILLGLLAATLFFAIVMFNFKGHDYPFHAQRIASIAEEIKAKGLGAFPIRIYSTNEYGYGYGSPLFYGDIFLYPIAILSLLGLNIVYGYRLMLLAVYTACFLSMFYCAKQISKDFKAALMCAVLYAFSSYFALDIFVRSALGEYFAFIFIPFACYGFYCIIINRDAPKRHRLFLVLGMAGLLLTHLISTLLTAIFMVIFGIIYCRKWIKNPKILLEAALLALLTAALCAFFIFPLLEQMLSAKFYTTEHTLYSFDWYKLRWESWLGPHGFWKLMGDRFPEIRDGAWFAGGFGYVMVVLIGIYAFNIKKLKNPLMISLTAASLLLILLAQGIILPLNVTEKIFGFMQFPYRILIICTLFMSISGAYAAYKLKSKKIDLLILGSVILSCMIVLVSSYKIIHKEIPNMADKYTLTTNQIGNGEYIPNELVESISDKNFGGYCQDRGDKVEVNHSDVAYSHENDNHGKITLTFSNNKHSDTAFELPLLMYKGYSAVNESTGEKYDVSVSEHGLVSVNVGGEADGTIIVEYTGTAVQHISDIISVIAIICLLIYLFKPTWFSAAVSKIKKKVTDDEKQNS